ncbi:helix-turn-helix transcriptional regulator [Virgibacillus oceani]|uniref:HTH cro/C1-type domain-containing protein n=1 Tax=Virgibacillus oceani TaxID=1479511 RepID=A0A917H1F3_9BACI|nr:helix-turn-helix domain-containing protein [Virgibacillus oceani]GGG64443.1 hypothetical protein GCM10011398_05030 [Virgibacillus oceani]
MGMTLKQARHLTDLSQEKLADLLGVHRHTYMKWERNPDEMTIGEAKHFSKVTGIPIDDINFFDIHSTLSRSMRGVANES